MITVNKVIVPLQLASFFVSVAFFVYMIYEIALYGPTHGRYVELTVFGVAELLSMYITYVVYKGRQYLLRDNFFCT